VYTCSLPQWSWRHFRVTGLHDWPLRDMKVSVSEARLLPSAQTTVVDINVNSVQREELSTSWQLGNNNY